MNPKVMKRNSSDGFVRVVKVECVKKPMWVVRVCVQLLTYGGVVGFVGVSSRSQKQFRVSSEARHDADNRGGV